MEIHPNRKFPKMVTTRLGKKKIKILSWIVFFFSLAQHLRKSEFFSTISLLNILCTWFSSQVPDFAYSPNPHSEYLESVSSHISLTLYLFCNLTNLGFFLFLNFEIILVADTDGSSGSDKNNSEPERKPKAVPSRREALPKPTNPSVPQSAHSTPQNVWIPN